MPLEKGPAKKKKKKQKKGEQVGKKKQTPIRNPALIPSGCERKREGWKKVWNQAGRVAYT